QARAIAQKLAGLRLQIKAKAGEGGRLFGSVTSADLAKELERHGITVDKRRIELEEPIKHVGSYEIPVKLYPGVQATLAGTGVVGAVGPNSRLRPAGGKGRQAQCPQGHAGGRSGPAAAGAPAPHLRGPDHRPAARPGPAGRCPG